MQILCFCNANAMHLHTVCLANAMQDYANKNKNKNKKEKLNINKKVIRLSVSIGRTGGVVFLFSKNYFLFFVVVGWKIVMNFLRPTISRRISYIGLALRVMSVDVYFTSIFFND